MTLQNTSTLTKTFERAAHVWNLLFALLIVDILIFALKGELVPPAWQQSLLEATPLLFTLSVSSLFRTEILNWSDWIAEIRFRLINPGSYVLKSIVVAVGLGLLSFEIVIKTGSALSLSAIPTALVLLFFTARPLFRSAIRYLKIQAAHAQLRLCYEKEFEKQYYILVASSLIAARLSIFLFSFLDNSLLFATSIIIFLMNKPHREEFIEPCPVCAARRSKVLTYFPGCKSCYPISFKDDVIERVREQPLRTGSLLKKISKKLQQTQIPLPKGWKTQKQNKKDPPKE